LDLLHWDVSFRLYWTRVAVCGVRSCMMGECSPLVNQLPLISMRALPSFPSLTLNFAYWPHTAELIVYLASQKLNWHCQMQVRGVYIQQAVYCSTTQQCSLLKDGK
jgi:hypothetical protein